MKRHDGAEDPRLTAYALGELDGEEKRTFEMELLGDSSLRRQVEELRRIGTLLSRELSAEEAPELRDDQREALTVRARATAASGRSPTRRIGRRFASVSAIAASLVIGTAIAVWTSQDGVAPFTYSSSRGQIGAGNPSSPALAGELASSRLRAGAELTDLERFLADQASRMPKNSKNPLMIRADKNTDLRFIQRIMELCREQGIEIWQPGLALNRGGGPKVTYTWRDTAVVQEPFNTEAYAPIVESPFRSVAQGPLSTFSIDVDTASYANVRRFLSEGRLPPPDAVRIEELVNYFTYGYAPPTGPEPFSAHVEVAASPWNPRHRLVRIGLKGRELADLPPRPRNLVFLIDVSGSMQPINKLPLLRRAMRLLVDHLDGQDRVAIVVYAGSSGLVLPSTSCDRRETILAAIELLRCMK